MIDLCLWMLVLALFLCTIAQISVYICKEVGADYLLLVVAVLLLVAVILFFLFPEEETAPALATNSEVGIIDATDTTTESTTTDEVGTNSEALATDKISYCHDCGLSFSPTAEFKFCPYCGASLFTTESASTETTTIEETVVAK